MNICFVLETWVALRSSEIEILGREDSQVKVNGYRIELGEIEKIVQSDPAVVSAVCCVKDKILAMYVVLSSSATGISDVSSVDIQDFSNTPSL